LFIGGYAVNEKLVLFLLCAVALALPAQQIPSDWELRPPQDTAATKYSVGVSQPSATEQEAVTGAWQNALQNFAASISTHFQGQTDISVRSESYSSGIEDAFTVYLENSSFSTNVQLTGVREMARKIERQNGRYIARLLAAMNIEDYNKARQYVENEESAFLAYRFFLEKGQLSSAGTGKPAGFPDYYSWLRNSALIISVHDPSQNVYMEQIDLLLKKVYKNAIVFAEIIDGRNARIIYNSARYYDGILRALQNTAVFTIQREGSHLVLLPLKASALADLKAAVNALKDSGKLVITGLETIQTQSGETINRNAIVAGQFRTLASRQFGLQAVNYTIPNQYLDGYVDEEGIIRHIQNNLASFPARYAVICYAETRLEKGMPEYRIPPLIIASCRFALYDVITGALLQSETAETNSGGFSPASLEDSAVIAESRSALQFLYNPKTHPGLADIMEAILSQL
jgi:hypothetical protein